MKTLRRISRNRAFAHVRILAAVLLVLAAAALALPGGFATRCCSAATAHASVNSKILQSGGF